MSTTEKIKKIMDSLDLGFSDYFKDENVRQLTLEKKLDIMQQSVELVTIEEALNFSIFSSEGSNHPTAEIYAIDFPSDLRASIYLLLGGYYRQAILCLRNWLEIRLTGIYFGFVNQDRTFYEDWKNGRKRAPIGQNLIKKLFSRAEFQKLDSKLGFRNKLSTIYTQLSAFTHGGILTRYNLQGETDNVPRFNPQSVELWFEFALRVFREIVICYFGAYGCKAFSMTTDEIDALPRYLSPSYMQELQIEGIC